MLNKRRRGSFSKSIQGSPQLNELMLRYAQDNQISNCLGCIIKGADVDYKDGALLTIACYLGGLKLIKAVLACGPTVNLETARSILERAEHDKALQMLNEYCDKLQSN